MGIISCTKTVTIQPTYSIQGLWIGTYVGNNSPAPASYFSFVIQPGGKMIVQSVVTGTDTAFGSGGWSLIGDSLKCSYTYLFPVISQTAAAIYNGSDTLSFGTWMDSFNTGTFRMTRIQ